MTKTEQYCYDQGRREERKIILQQVTQWFMKTEYPVGVLHDLQEIIGEVK